MESGNSGDAYRELLCPLLFVPAGERVAELLPECGSILDVACGSGALTPLLRKNAGQVVALDCDPDMLSNFCQPKGIQRVLGVFDSLPFVSSSFDCVVVQFGIMFAKNQQSVFDECMRVVRNDGSVWMTRWCDFEQNFLNFSAQNSVREVMQDRTLTWYEKPFIPIKINQKPAHTTRIEMALPMESPETLAIGMIEANPLVLKNCTKQQRDDSIRLLTKIFKRKHEYQAIFEGHQWKK